MASEPDRLNISKQIYDLFKEKNQEISTNNIIKALFTNQWSQTQEIFMSEFSTKKEKFLAKNLRAKLHRRVIYHLNKLVNKNILRVVRLNPKGEKVFMLANRFRIVNNMDYSIKPSFLTPTKLYEDRGIVHYYSQNDWLSKINAVVINTEQFDSFAILTSIIQEIIPCVNDVIALDNFESLMNVTSSQEIESFVLLMSKTLYDYNIRLRLLIDSSLVELGKFIKVIEGIISSGHKVIQLVIKTSPKSAIRLNSLLGASLDLFMHHNLKLNIHNTLLWSSPLFTGRAGVYGLNQGFSFSEDVLGVVVSSTSLAVDVKRFMMKFKSFSEFRSLMLKAARSLLIANSIQFKAYKENLKRLQVLASKNPAIILSHSKNYIRVWNYNWEGLERENMIQLFKSIQEELKSFARSEEMIYKSCGLPLRFSISLATAFKGFNSGFLSHKKYFKNTIKGLKELNSNNMQRFFRVKEQLAGIFETGDRTRIFHKPTIKDELLKEIKHLLITKSLPLITYDFSSKPRDVSLTRFLNSV